MAPIVGSIGELRIKALKAFKKAVIKAKEHSEIKSIKRLLKATKPYVSERVDDASRALLKEINQALKAE